jgi:hypothetical protein
VGSAQGATEPPRASPAGAEVPKGAVLAPGAWCESFAHKDLRSFLEELAAAYGRGETILWVHESEDLEHPHRYVACKRTS